MDDKIDTLLAECGLAKDEGRRKRMRSVIEDMQEKDKEQQAERAKLQRVCNTHFAKLGIARHEERYQGRVPPKDQRYEYDSYWQSESSITDEFSEPSLVVQLYDKDNIKCIHFSVELSYEMRVLLDEVEFSNEAYQVSISVREGFKYNSDLLKRTLKKFLEERYAALINYQRWKFDKRLRKAQIGTL